MKKIALVDKAKSYMPVSRNTYLAEVWKAGQKDDALRDAKRVILDLKEHSTILNEIGWRLAVSKGLVGPEDDVIEVDLGEILPWMDALLETFIQERDENVRLTYLLGSRADGNKCSCTMLTGDSLEGPADWEQDMECPTHGSIEYVLAERQKMIDGVAQVLGFYTVVG